jgi:HEAT repeat protein
LSLFNLLKDRDENVRLAAVSGVVNLAEHGKLYSDPMSKQLTWLVADLRKAICLDVASLIELLKDNIPVVRASAAMVIKDLFNHGQLCRPSPIHLFLICSFS